MYLPPLQPIINSEIRICGDVEIHPTASIAPGVILQAAPNSRIAIGADVCVGMGVIISAYGGAVEIADGATLGSGVLVIGRSQIGRNACIGTATTIFNTNVNAMVVIEPGSIIGDNSRSNKTEPISSPPEPTIANSSAAGEEVITPNNNGHSGFQPTSRSLSTDSEEVKKSNLINNNSFQKELVTEQISARDTDLEDENQTSFENKYHKNSNDPWIDKDSISTESEKEVEITVKEIENNLKTEDGTAIGKVYIDQLLVTLFPHKKHLK